MTNLFNVYIWDEDFDPEAVSGEQYYVVTGNGIFFNKITKAGSALVPVEGLPWCKKPEISFRLQLPKVPGLILMQALTFFRQVFEKYNSESYLTIMYSEKLNQYMLWCPKQTVTHTSVNYDRTDQPNFENRQVNGWQMVGTIHSHCDFSAFHSGTDVHDEDSFDGIHITLGHVNKEQISMESSISFNKNREKMEPENCCSGVVRVTNKDIAQSGVMVYSNANTHFFNIELTEEEAQQLAIDMEVIKNEWMNKVVHNQPQISTKYYGNYQKVNWQHYPVLDSEFEDPDFEDLNPKKKTKTKKETQVTNSGSTMNTSSIKKITDIFSGIFKGLF